MLANIIQRSLVAAALTGFFVVGASAQSAPAPQPADTQNNAADVQNGQTNPSNGTANSNPSGAPSASDRKTLRHDRAQVIAARNQLLADANTYGVHSPQVKQDHANLKALRATLQTDRSSLLREKAGQ